MGLLEITFVVLLILKLTGIAMISWWWVFSPLLIAVGVYLIAGSIMAATGGAALKAANRKPVTRPGNRWS